MGSPSSSTKFEVNGMLKICPWTKETAAGTVATLGAAFVILSMKLDVILEVKLSDTFIVIQ
jgi:hypothetical protein